MSKTLVICCDGTWNTPDQASPTNVTKVSLSVADTDGEDNEQRTFYHRGVGSIAGERIRGGAFGYGLSRDVLETYDYLVENYEPGDKLFFFGFSRGAFTARSTAGLIHNSGILRSTERHRMGEAFALYRDNGAATKPRGVEATLFRRSHSHEPRIHFIGVWDTVGSLGVPIDGLHLASWFNRRWRFHDTDLSSSVDSAYHALSIDEKRGPFRPTLWSLPDDADQGQTLEQVWFTGGHSDVGGGNPRTGLSDISLLWMVSRAEQAGLRFRGDAFAPCNPGGNTDDCPVKKLTCAKPDPLEEFGNSRTGLYRFLPRFDRVLGGGEHGHESVASSATHRYDEDPTYRPVGLERYIAQEHSSTDVEHSLPDSPNVSSLTATVPA